MTRSRRLRTAVLATAAMLLGACGGATEPASFGLSGADVETLDLDLPGEVLGLAVDDEDVSETVELIEDTFVEALSVHSFREAELLQATLQVSRFADVADHGSEEFRRTIVNGLGGQLPRAVRVGDDTVWLTTGTSQILGVWFREKHFYVLAIRSGFARPRTLLREVLEVTT